MVNGKELLLRELRDQLARADDLVQKREKELQDILYELNNNNVNIFNIACKLEAAREKYNEDVKRKNIIIENIKLVENYVFKGST